MPPYPEEPDYYSEPTQAARYGGYYDEPAPPVPWYRRPAALVAAGAIGAIVLAALVFAVVKLATGSPAHGPVATTTTTTTTTDTPSTVTAWPSTETSTVTQTVTVPQRREPFGGPFGGR